MPPELRGLRGELRHLASTQIPDLGSHTSPWRQKEKRLGNCEHRVSRGCMAAILCSCARYDDRIDAPLPKNNIQIGAEEAAVAMFLNDVFTGLRP